MTAPAQPIAGYEVPAVEAWITAHVTGLTPPLSWTRLEGGHSNLTYLLEDPSGRKAVIRRPPLGELLPMAHDMAREWALLSALAPTPVPVPAPLGFCEDPTVTGARFYLMGHVDAHPLYSAADTELYAPSAVRQTLAHGFIDALADLHTLDPDLIGLGNLGKRENYVGRQLNAWYRSWNASIEGARFDDPRAHKLEQFLRQHMPDQGPARVVHGDYGLHNCLIAPGGKIAAVVDWEVSTLGDPLADLAYALNPWPDPTDPAPPRPEAATSPAGFPTRTQLAARYGARTGADLSRLDYYMAFSRWKSAAIIHGVYARYLEGKKSTLGVDLAALRDQIDRSLAAAQLAADRLVR